MDYQQNLIEFAELFNLDQAETKDDATIISTITSTDIVKWNSIFQDKMQLASLYIYLYWAGELIKPHIDRLK